MKSILDQTVIKTGWLFVVGVAVLGLACSESGSQNIVAGFPVPTGEWRQIVPSDTLPAAVTTDLSNNNLDAIEYDGSIFLAFRTAPTHFASDQVLMHVIRNDDVSDLSRWEHELTIQTGNDLREPRFFVLNDKLYFYISELGTNLTAFEPGRVFGVTRDPAGNWSNPQTVFTNGTVVWRTKTRNGKVLMTAYTGGENIYQNRSSDEQLEVLFLTTEDGWTWEGVNPEKPVVLTGGVSETGFEFDAAGDLYAVIRNEAGDDSGFGSRLCMAPAAALSDWECLPKSDPNKYDSPLMFRYKDLLYLIARYNPDGPYDLNPGEPVSADRFLENAIRYSTTTKRTALYGYDTENMKIELLDIFPSNGDTSFASAVWLEPDKRLLVFNYSSDINGPEMTWIEGQFAGSQIYAAILEF